MPSAGQLYTFCGQDSGRSSPTDAKPRVDWLPRTFLRSSSSSFPERGESPPHQLGGLGGFCLRHCAISNHGLNQPSSSSLRFVFFIFHLPLTTYSVVAYLCISLLIFHFSSLSRACLARFSSAVFGSRVDIVSACRRRGGEAGREISSRRYGFALRLHFYAPAAFVFLPASFSRPRFYHTLRETG